MRVFYPISARLSDLVNEQTTVKSGWMPVFSVVTIALIAIVSLNLTSFEGGAAEKQHELFTQNHTKQFTNNIAIQHQQHNTQS
jgi:hypothetical protein